MGSLYIAPQKFDATNKELIFDGEAEKIILPDFGLYIAKTTYGAAGLIYADKDTSSSDNVIYINYNDFSASTKPMNIISLKFQNWSSYLMELSAWQYSSDHEKNRNLSEWNRTNIKQVWRLG